MLFFLKLFQWQSGTATTDHHFALTDLSIFFLLVTIISFIFTSLFLNSISTLLLLNIFPNAIDEFFSAMRIDAATARWSAAKVFAHRHSAISITIFPMKNS